MAPLSTILTSTLLLVPTSVLASVHKRDDGYIGYSLTRRGNNDTAVFDTVDTPSSVLDSDSTPPDVLLNATVSLKELDINVENLTAKVDIDARVMNLLSFNAGVQAHAGKVELKLEDVRAHVILEARLENLVEMIDEVLDAVDKNPSISGIDSTATSNSNSTTGQGSNSTSSGATQKRSPSSKAPSYSLEHNILYSTNDYSHNTHTNSVLAQDGNIIDEHLDNDGHKTRPNTVVGYYSRDMKFTGHNRSVTLQPSGTPAFELEYMYMPYVGLEVASLIYVNRGGAVLATKVIAELEAGGSSTISDDDEAD